eukprot:5798302-Pyramimonas_sp.AAC.1
MVSIIGAVMPAMRRLGALGHSVDRCAVQGVGRPRPGLAVLHVLVYRGPCDSRPFVGAEASWQDRWPMEPVGPLFARRTADSA